MSWLFQILLNSLWVPLNAYSQHLGLSVGFTGTVFAVSVGARCFPNWLVMRMGASSELVMMTATFLGYAVSFMWPAEPWALFVLAFCSAMGFTRPCVTLHMQVACEGDLDSLMLASKRCGAARSCADICSFIFPAFVYQSFGWVGVTIFGASTALMYLLLAVRRHLGQRMSAVTSGEKSGLSDERRNSEQQLFPQGEGVPIQWIDWIIAGAFVSTELQINLFNTSVPTALVQEYEVPTASVGTLLGLGAFITFCYVIMLPSMPSLCNTWRKPNLLVTYFAMFAAWTLMLVAVILFPVGPFVFSMYLFQMMANLSQIELLESLAGALDQASTTKVVGISEMFGCSFATVGSYLGMALQTFGIPSPFTMCMLWSFLSWSVLLFAMGLRRYENRHFREKPYAVFTCDRSLICQSIVGLRYIFVAGGDENRSYITNECIFRQSLADPLLRDCDKMLHSNPAIQHEL